MRLMWMVAAIITLVHVTMLMQSYRASGDDVSFFGNVIEGKVWDTVLGTTFGQGRVGSFFIMPVNHLAAYLLDNPAFRMLCILIYLGVFLAFALYVERLLRARCAAGLYLMLVSLNIIAPFHLPPAAYPLQNTVAFLAILCLRLAIVRRRMERPSDVRPDRFEMICTGFFAVAMLTSEFAFMMGTALLAAEHLALLPAGSGRKAVGRLVTAPRFAVDLGAALLVLGVYMGFRLAFPSYYDGNKPGPVSTLHHGVYTALNHAFRLHLLAAKDLPRAVGKVGADSLAIAAAAGMLAGFVSAHSLPLLRSVPRPGMVAAVAATLTLYVVAPNALTLRMQRWCVLGDICVYLDSSTAYLGATVVIFALSALLSQLVETGRAAAAVRIGLACGFGVLTAATIIYDRKVPVGMEAASATWANARRIVCSVNPNETRMAAVFDPDRSITMHLAVDREAFWRNYRDHFGRDC